MKYFAKEENRFQVDFSSPHFCTCDKREGEAGRLNPCFWPRVSLPCRAAQSWIRDALGSRMIVGIQSISL